MITFDNNKYRWKNPDTGELEDFLRVTEIIWDILGWTTKVHFKAAKADFGTRVHTHVENYINGTVQPDDIEDLNERAHLEAYIHFQEQTNWQPKEIEKIVYCTKRRYAGRVDQIGRYAGVPAILDIKTSAAASKFTGYQLAAYASALGDHDMTRIALHLNSDHDGEKYTGKYHIHFYRDPMDFHVFNALAVLWPAMGAKHWQNQKDLFQRISRDG